MTAERTVLVVLHEEWLGGATLAVLKLVPLLEERGWNFAFWVPPGPAYEQLRAAGARVEGAERPVSYTLRALRLPPGPLRRTLGLPRYLHRFSRFLHDVDPHLVHANTLLTVAEAAVARARRYPVLMHVHDMLPPGPRGALTRRFASRLQAVVAVSEASAKALGSDGAMPRVVYNGVEVPQDPLSDHDVRDRFVIGTVGFISPTKGSDVFVEAAEQVGRRRPDIEFRMVGAARDALHLDWARRLLARAKAAGIRHVAETDVEAELREWNVLVLPSRQETLGLALLEAMALGLPVIGSRTGGIPELITPDCGVLVPSGDAAALAESMLRMAERPAAAREAMGRAGRERVLHQFTVDAAAAGLDHAYKSAIERT